MWGRLRASKYPDSVRFASIRLDPPRSGAELDHLGLDGSGLDHLGLDHLDLDGSGLDHLGLDHLDRELADLVRGISYFRRAG